MSDSGEGATKYFDAALGTTDYYAKDNGQWGGKVAEKLGLGNEVMRKQFIALALNKGKRLTKPTYHFAAEFVEVGG